MTMLKWQNEINEKLNPADFAFDLRGSVLAMEIAVIAN
jgi:hypothetical protein